MKFINNFFYLLSSLVTTAKSLFAEKPFYEEGSVNKLKLKNIRKNFKICMYIKK